MRLITAYIFLLSVAVVIGCSSSKPDPVSSRFSDEGYIPRFDEPEYDNVKTKLLGTWNFSFDKDVLSHEIEPFRAAEGYYDVTGMIPNPVIQINSWDPVEEVIDVDITLQNPAALNVFDVRLIIFTDDVGHSLLEPDDWTHLFDIPEGLYSNPFRAYAKTEPNRLFIRFFLHQENFRILCPESNFTVQFAVIASYPGNCDEPYEINNFQQDRLTAELGASAWMYVDVYDWQQDVNKVTIQCPEITGVMEVEFSHISGETWGVEIINDTGAAAGEYGAIIESFSTGSGALILYDRVKIIVSPQSGVPSNPVIIGGYSTIGACQDMVSEGDFSYVADSYGLRIVDHSDPASPLVVGQMRISVWLYHIAKSGNYIYLASDDGIRIIDVSVPETPLFVSAVQHDLSNMSSHDFKVNNSYAYFASRETKVVIFDVNDPQSPFVFSNYNTSTSSLEFEGDVAFLGATIFVGTHSTQVISVVDFSNPSSPAELGYAETWGPVDALDISGDFLYISDSSLAIADISDLTAPEIIDRENNEHEGYIRDIEVSGDYLYASTIRGDASPFLVFEGLSLISSTDYGSGSNALSYSDGYAYVAGFRGYFIFNVQNPYDPFVAGQVKNFYPFDVVVTDNYACLVTRDGFTVLDINDPTNPQFVNEFEFEYNYHRGDLLVSGNYVYMVGAFMYTNGLNQSVLSIFDISDIANPVQTGYLEISYYSLRGFDKSMDYIYVPQSDRVLVVIDVSEPSAPQIINKVDTIRAGRDIKIAGDYAYVACDNGLDIFDLNNPQVPELIGTCEIDYNPRRIEVQQDYAYLASSSYENPQKLTLVNITDPTSPEVIETFQGYTGELKISGNYLYILKNSFTVVDISDPLSPILVSNTDDIYGKAIDVVDNYAYIPNGYEFDIVELWQ